MIEKVKELLGREGGADEDVVKGGGVGGKGKKTAEGKGGFSGDEERGGREASRRAGGCGGEDNL
ncbi:hypothetical protein IEQ34_005253 [Dendrobium chrysotoxum]|uniref:Uncharacterized protein n=1 Tax=Dendrobium chrysotoxum TaxID=161865 RepID=A0AAV7GTF1_DENCH|nr:hypothetical protein IEQ34_005253 [Dendrobium chrysotoxum]